MTQTALLKHKTIIQLIAFTVIAYGLVIIGGSLLRQLRIHNGDRDIGDLFVAVPLITGLSFVYLGSLLARRKYNAWVAALALFVFVLGLNLAQIIRPVVGDHMTRFALGRGILVPLLILFGLLASRGAFRVRSDMRSFKQSMRFSIVVLLVALLYGTGGFMLLDKHDFHQEISPAGALLHTVDQFGLTTNSLVPYTRRSKLFLDSLSVISVATGAYIAISFFQPLRARLVDQTARRKRAELLLENYPSDIDDFFKLWPHDKLYFFDNTNHAGVAYRVVRGQALVVGDPFGDPGRFRVLFEQFFELCFVNDWQPVFVHISQQHESLYKDFGFRLQKIGEEAVVDLHAFQMVSNDKYFRQIRNKFMKLGYHVELLEPPHNAEIVRDLKRISDDWLQRPGRAERGFMLGYFDEDYLQRGALVVAVDEAHRIQGFINLVPTFDSGGANFDLLRSSKEAPGNINDFMLLGLIEILLDKGMRRLNMGLTPLAGLDNEPGAEMTLVHNALKLVYLRGDRFYSFSGLRRFKEKYAPAWQGRYVAYRGGTASFTRAFAALNRAMKAR